MDSDLTSIATSLASIKNAMYPLLFLVGMIAGSILWRD